MNLNEIQEQRYFFLKTLYEFTGGATRVSTTIEEINSVLKYDDMTLHSVFEYLKNEGFIIEIALGGLIKITHKGIKEYETLLDKEKNLLNNFEDSINSIYKETETNQNIKNDIKTWIMACKPEDAKTDMFNNFISENKLMLGWDIGDINNKTFQSISNILSKNGLSDTVKIYFDIFLNKIKKNDIVILKQYPNISAIVRITDDIQKDYDNQKYMNIIYENGFYKRNFQILYNIPNKNRKSATATFLKDYLKRKAIDYKTVYSTDLTQQQIDSFIDELKSNIEPDFVQLGYANQIKFMLGADSPSKFDIIFAPINSNGDKGELNTFVIESLGLSENILPKDEDLKKGYAKVLLNGKAIIFVVTIDRNKSTSELLETNLLKVLEDHEIWKYFLQLEKNHLKILLILVT